MSNGAHDALDAFIIKPILALAAVGLAAIAALFFVPLISAGASIYAGTASGAVIGLFLLQVAVLVCLPVIYLLDKIWPKEEWEFVLNDDGGLKKVTRTQAEAQKIQTYYHLLEKSVVDNPLGQKFLNKAKATPDTILIYVHDKKEGKADFALVPRTKVLGNMHEYLGRVKARMPVVVEKQPKPAAVVKPVVEAATPEKKESKKSASKKLESAKRAKRPAA